MKVDKVLNILKESDPANTQLEKDYPMIECSIYADAVDDDYGKREAAKSIYQQTWHYWSRPNYDGVSEEEAKKEHYNEGSKKMQKFFMQP